MCSQTTLTCVVVSEDGSHKILQKSRVFFLLKSMYLKTELDKYTVNNNEKEVCYSSFPVKFACR